MTSTTTETSLKTTTTMNKMWKKTRKTTPRPQHTTPFPRTPFTDRQVPQTQQLQPPYTVQAPQIRDPPHSIPEIPAAAIPIVSEEFAVRTVANMYNVRTPARLQLGLGTSHLARPLPRGMTTLFHGMTSTRWNSHRLRFNSQEGKQFRQLLTELYLSVLHHVEEIVVNNSASTVFCFPRCRSRRWLPILSTLLAPFQTQLYLESDRHSMSAGIWGDFVNAQRPHQDELDYAVEEALNIAM